MKLLEAEGITVKYGEQTVLKDVSLALDEGQWLMIAGQNGAGKSTLVNAISGAVPHAGSVFYRGQDVRHFKPRRLARCMGVLTQNHSLSYAFTVEEVVRLGRYPYSEGVFGKRGDGDEAMVAQALEQTGLTQLKHKSVLTLSGGELQRTFLAQLIAQNPQILILDEPSNNLDLVYQKQTFQLIAKWLKEEGRAAISISHDLSLAKAYGTHALLLEQGKTIAQGETEKVLTPENLHQAYSMDVYSWMQDMLGRWS